MGTEASLSSDATTRELVEFYLLDHRTPLGKTIDITLFGLNLVFIGVFVVETYPVSSSMQSLLWVLEVGIATVFLVEYVLRLYGAPDRVDEFLDGYTIVDLLTILPTLVVVLAPVGAVAAVNIGFLRVLRVIRVLRFYRFTKDQRFFFGTVELETLRAMKLLLTVISIFFVSAGLFYTAETRVNPDVSTFGDAFYYTVVTLTTVGFGDIVPTTDTGRWVTIGSILAGIILIPWQAGRIIKVWTYREKVNVTCRTCGLEYHDPDASHCKACGHVIYQPYDSRS
ncbi:ion transporter [Haloarchaeobius sp. TZWWS8]|uniref:ion transporter n=1 Tax=Haloarchaeobius sp. TZWWS8 TaxID=3446121 RepID=UPI003EB96ED9